MRKGDEILEKEKNQRILGVKAKSETNLRVYFFLSNWVLR